MKTKNKKNNIKNKKGTFKLAKTIKDAMKYLVTKERKKEKETRKNRRQAIGNKKKGYIN